MSAYNKTTWVEEVTPTSPANMNNIEQGVADAHAGLADQDPDLVPLQHGVAKGGATTRIDATHIRVAAGKGWILQASGLLRPVTWAQTDLVVPLATGAGNTRIDQAAVDSAGNVTRLAGTAEGAGYTFAGRQNAAAVPVGSLRLSDVYTDTAGLTSDANNIRDRRPWAKGARIAVRYTGGQIDYPGTAMSNVIPDIVRRMELGSGSLKMKIKGRFWPPVGIGVGIFTPLLNDAAPAPVTDWACYAANNHADQFIDLEYIQDGITPGSLKLSWGWRSSGAQTITLLAVAGSPLDVEYVEELRPSQSNGSA